MGHGKNKKNQKVGIGQERKETKEERRLRIEEEAQAREYCFQILPYAIGGVVFVILVFALYVHSLPPKLSEIIIDGNDAKTDILVDDGGFAEVMKSTLDEQTGGPDPDPDVVNLDGESL